MGPFRVRLRPQAEVEIAEAMEWYSQRVTGLERQFLATVSAAIEGLSHNPRRFTTVHNDIRRVVLNRFPYLLFYVVEGEEVVVLACVHERRNPDRWPEGS